MVDDARRERVRAQMRADIAILNRIEPHLGCVVCRGPIIEGRCPVCQPEETR